MEQVGEIVGREFDWMRAINWSGPCHGCGMSIQHPGLCCSCAAEYESKRKTDRAKHALSDVRGTIPKRMRWARFGSSDLPRRVATQDACQQSFLAVDALLAGNASLILVGPAGSGKTSLACAVLCEVALAKSLHTARFQCAIDLGQSRYRQRYGGEAFDVERSKAASLLVLDDLGSEHKNGVETVAEVIRYRHGEEKPTIYTTWIDPDSFAEHYGDGIARRINDSAIVVRVGGGQ